MKNNKKYFLIFMLVFSFTLPSFAGYYPKGALLPKYQQALKVGCKDVKVKNPKFAAAFGLLPGGGSFYTGDLSLGFLNLVIWPVSPLWDIPISYNKSKQLNQEATVFMCQEEGKLN